MGQLHSLGKLGPPDHKTASDWYTKAANDNHLEAQCALARLHLEGKLGPPDHEMASKWYTKAADQGQVEFQIALGDLYFNGTLSGTPDYDAASFWYSDAGRNGHLESQVALGNMFRDRKLGSPSMQAQHAVDWFSKAGEQGHAESQAQVAMLCSLHHDSSPRLKSSLLKHPNRTWPELTKLAEQDDIFFLRALGHLYRFSYNNAAAKVWYGKAAAHSDPDSLFGLWCIDPFDQKDKWLAKAAERGHAEAQLEFARATIKSDQVEGVKWLTKAADQGNAGAQLALGQYFLGKYDWLTFRINESRMVVPIDPQAAVGWLTKAAEQQHDALGDALELLGNLFYYGKNVPKDYEAAFKWYSKKPSRFSYYLSQPAFDKFHEAQRAANPA